MLALIAVALVIFTLISIVVLADIRQATSVADVRPIREPLQPE